jgi:8-oxo-dGTP diphosphatase
MNIRPAVGVALIIMKDDKVLLGKRKNAHGTGTWLFREGFWNLMKPSKPLPSERL